MTNPAVWAVYLGANTPRRLAREWDIPIARAARILGDLHRAGAIDRRGRGRYHTIPSELGGMGKCPMCGGRTIPKEHHVKLSSHQ